jgi:hypothetical protein
VLGVFGFVGDEKNYEKSMQKEFENRKKRSIIDYNMTT